MVDNDSKTLTLQSSTDEIRHLKSFLEELQQWAGFNDEKLSGIRLALNEAVMNAIKHGNKNDPAKKVYISAKIHEGVLLVNVKDEGSGFDAAEIPNPTDEDNLLKPSGRGVFLIRKQADEAFISKEDAAITMKFNLE